MRASWVKVKPIRRCSRQERASRLIFFWASLLIAGRNDIRIVPFLSRTVRAQIVARVQQAAGGIVRRSPQGQAMATDFATCLRRFLTSYLAGLRGCSPNTIASYRDTFKLLIAWFRDERSVPPGRWPRPRTP
jgi:hypothetical protein